ncbi:hypothetical protein AC578_3748 [Pseudocercospora eumusae]|uniref:Uncharacterized protein n=1 Tax=Pseudocercospora eumusae TaxID=321146 RepID=A0A139HSX1_9PEZI|nr:hypothetical protein AC578_3748 [Pseudocercospora eumusae]
MLKARGLEYPTWEKACRNLQGRDKIEFERYVFIRGKDHPQTAVTVPASFLQLHVRIGTHVPRDWRKSRKCLLRRKLSLAALTKSNKPCLDPPPHAPVSVTVGSNSKYCLTEFHRVFATALGGSEPLSWA